MKRAITKESQKLPPAGNIRVHDVNSSACAPRLVRINNVCLCFFLYLSIIETSYLGDTVDNERSSRLVNKAGEGKTRDTD